MLNQLKIELFINYVVVLLIKSLMQQTCKIYHDTSSYNLYTEKDR